MYINKIDCMVTIAFTIALLIFGNLSFYNDTIWLLIIYIMSLFYIFRHVLYGFYMQYFIKEYIVWCVYQ